MAIPENILGQVGELAEILGRLSATINEALSERVNPQTNLRIESVLAEAETLTNLWLRQSADLTAALASHQQRVPGDAVDVGDRLMALGLLQVAVANDLALLQPFEEESINSLVNAVDFDLPRYASSISETAFGEGNLLEAIRNPDEPATDDNPTVELVVGDIINRAGSCTVAIASGLAAGPAGRFIHSLATEVTSAISDGSIDFALADPPGLIARLVRRLIRRANEALKDLLQGYRPAATDAAKQIFTQANPDALILDNVASRVIARVLQANSVRDAATYQLSKVTSARTRDERLNDLGKLAKKHKRWVAPIRRLGPGLSALWLVPGPVPVAPVAAGALLVWTILISADDLDTPLGHFPNLRRGVVMISSGL
jgi:hypothetical protein